VQFTRAKDGLGNVLRKIWHDQQVLAGRMRHPAADMVASLLLHEPGGSTCMATHPRLAERIRRVCGSLLPPLPAPLLRLEAVEARHAPSVPPGMLLAANSPAPAPDPARLAQEAHQQRLAADREAMLRLQGRVGPNERQLIVLALMMNLHNERERKLWHRMAEGLHDARSIVDDVGALLPIRRVPEFERLCTLIAVEPLLRRRELVENARDLLRADGKVSPRERLWWLALRHRMGEHQSRQAFMRPMTGQGQTLDQLAPHELAHVAALSRYLARFIPIDQSPGASAEQALGKAWLKGVMARCGGQTAHTLLSPPDADALMHALAGVQELSWMMRPMLIKAWVEEAVNHSPQGVLSHDCADALRLVAGLIDSPLPPMLEAHYPPRA
jgi:hypothetical protein